MKTNMFGFVYKLLSLLYDLGRYNLSLTSEITGPSPPVPKNEVTVVTSPRFYRSPMVEKPLYLKTPSRNICAFDF